MPPKVNLEYTRLAVLSCNSCISFYLPWLFRVCLRARVNSLPAGYITNLVIAEISSCSKPIIVGKVSHHAYKTCTHWLQHEKHGFA
jgi:hypothetical protein